MCVMLMLVVMSKMHLREAKDNRIKEMKRWKALIKTVGFHIGLHRVSLPILGFFFLFRLVSTVCPDRCKEFVCNRNAIETLVTYTQKCPFPALNCHRACAHSPVRWEVLCMPYPRPFCKACEEFLMYKYRPVMKCWSDLLQMWESCINYSSIKNV